MQGPVAIEAIPGLPMVRPGDDLAVLILRALADNAIALKDGDILVVAQKIVSKAEDRLVRMDDVEPSAEALALAAETEKEPELVELLLRESSEVVRRKPGVMIMRHRLGIVGANAGIDRSNIEHEGGEMALLLPLDPDASAAALRDAIRAATGTNIGIIISDSMNRPWRLGTTGQAIGCAGITVIDDRRGGFDTYGRELKVTMINRADSIAAMATLLMGETDERTPVALVRGFAPEDSDQRAADIIRPLEEDLFR
jgi:coenzyme F420-0:L-glutamate ligase / coenzyme F420-1:gamma-L-glutamate ligase